VKINSFMVTPILCLVSGRNIRLLTSYTTLFCLLTMCFMPVAVTCAATIAAGKITHNHQDSLELGLVLECIKGIASGLQKFYSWQYSLGKFSKPCFIAYESAEKQRF